MQTNTIQKIDRQLNLLAPNPVFPSTRFQGSKLKISDWIWEAVQEIKF